MIETNKYYILKEPFEYTPFKKGDLVWVEQNIDKKCQMGFNNFIVKKYKDDMISYGYCECSSYRFKSLKNTWWKCKNYNIHFKIIDDTPHEPLYYYGSVCEKSIKEKTNILKSILFENYKLCEQY